MSRKGKQHSHGDLKAQLYKLKKPSLVCSQEEGLRCDPVHTVRRGEVRRTFAVNFREENAPHGCSSRAALLCVTLQPQA